MLKQSRRLYVLGMPTGERLRLPPQLIQVRTLATAKHGQSGAPRRLCQLSATEHRGLNGG